MTSLDVFGAPVNLNVAGEETVKSLTGSFLTVSVMIILVIFGMQRLQILTTRSSPQITQNLVTDAMDLTFNTSFNKVGFKVAWTVQDHNSLEAKDNSSYVMF